MTNHSEPGGGGGFPLVLAAAGMGLCCALPVLLVSVGLGAFFGWFAEGNVGWLLLAGLLVAVALFARGRRRAAGRSDRPAETDAARISPDRANGPESRGEEKT